MRQRCEPAARARGRPAARARAARCGRRGSHADPARVPVREHAARRRRRSIRHPDRDPGAAHVDRIGAGQSAARGGDRPRPARARLHRRRHARLCAVLRPVSNAAVWRQQPRKPSARGRGARRDERPRAAPAAQRARRRTDRDRRRAARGVRSDVSQLPRAACRRSRLRSGRRIDGANHGAQRGDRGMGTDSKLLPPASGATRGAAGRRGRRLRAVRAARGWTRLLQHRARGSPAWPGRVARVRQQQLHRGRLYRGDGNRPDRGPHIPLGRWRRGRARRDRHALVR